MRTVYDCYGHLYVGDDFADTLSLNAGEHSALRRLLLESWCRGLAMDDDKKLAASAGLTPRAWRTVKPAILELLVDMRPRIDECVRHLRAYDGQRLPSAAWQIVRSIAFERDCYECTYCGAGRSLQGDHIIPLTRGGSNILNNVTTACKRCNQSKGSKTPEEWRASGLRDGTQILIRGARDG